MVSPRGLSRSLAIFATVLLRPSPIEQVTPSTETRRADALRYLNGMFVAKPAGADVKERLVYGYAVDEWGLICENGHDARAHLAIAIEVAGRPDGLGAQAFGLGGRHGRANTVDSRLI